MGKAARKRTPRESLGELPTQRADAVALVDGQATVRVADLIPVREQRMSQTPFTFLRGAALVMADDLSRAPHSGLLTQICGDAHLSNFGAYAAPDRSLVFDLNDFDETAVGPFEWDVKRLAASIVVSARELGIDADRQGELARLAAATYRTATSTFAGMSTLDIWYARVDTARLAALAEQVSNAVDPTLEKNLRKAQNRTSLKARDRLTTVVDGTRRFVDDPPLLQRVGDELTAEEVASVLAQYRDSLPPDRQRLLRRYTPVDVAHKVVGVGSVGLMAFLVLFDGRDSDDPLMLQIKQAVDSVIAGYIEQPPSAPEHQGQRVVQGQLLMQAASDIFLGWATGPRRGRHFYWRQFRDMKWSPDILTLSVEKFTGYVQLCAWLLARAHARTGDPLAVAAYLGGSEKFDRAIEQWAVGYADLTETDHAAFVQAVGARAASRSRITW
ncbi:MAG: DUF2252 domain-containing protein [Steroidobacteraceae bacterium]